MVFTVSCETAFGVEGSILVSRGVGGGIVRELQMPRAGLWTAGAPARLVVTARV